MALLDRQEVRDLLTAARATRNYCMLTGRGRDKTDRLIDALAPFDGSPSQVRSTHLVDLRKAMRDVCRDIDDYTLTRILDGDPPVRIGFAPAKSEKNGDDGGVKPGRASWIEDIIGRARTGWPSLWQRIVLPGLAILLLILAMHYTHWSFNANLLLSRLDDHKATDVHDEVRDLIVIARAIETNGESTTAPGASTPAQKLFNQTMSTLKAYHYQEGRLLIESSEAAVKFDVFIAAREFIGDIPAKLFPPVERQMNRAQDKKTTLAGMPGSAAPQTDVNLDPERTLSAASKLVDTVQKVERETSDEVALAKDVLDEGLRDQISPEVQAAMSSGKQEDIKNLALLQIALSERKGFLKIVRDIAEETGRNYSAIAGDHVVTRLELLKDANNLADKISVANRFVLPMIYGSLGAALFCLVRVLTPALSDLGPARAFLRILFGAFAAMTLSMLFIPANVFSINDQSNPTLIFLACFLFGYSFDAVLSALHRLEAFLQGRLQSQDSGNPT